MGTPQPQLILQIGADPTAWYLGSVDRAALAAQLSEATSPVTVNVVSPLAGQLVLSTRAAGSVQLGPPQAGTGTHPTDGRLPGSPPTLYVPRASSPGPGDPGFPLDPATDLAALAQQIVTAMSAGTVLTVPFGSPMSGHGTLILSGASLAFAVLCPPKPVGPPGG